MPRNRKVVWNRCSQYCWDGVALVNWKEGPGSSFEAHIQGGVCRTAGYARTLRAMALDASQTPPIEKQLLSHFEESKGGGDAASLAFLPGPFEIQQTEAQLIAGPGREFFWIVCLHSRTPTA